MKTIFDGFKRGVVSTVSRNRLQSVRIVEQHWKVECDRISIKTSVGISESSVVEVGPSMDHDFADIQDIFTRRFFSLAFCYYSLCYQKL